MPLALSIDNYLDAHPDEGVELCGKLAISKAILAAERGGKLFFNRDKRQQLSFEKLEDTWFVAFHQLLTEGLAKEHVKKIFENVSIINFNYDRCLEHFLHNALQVYYAIPEQDAADVLSDLYVFHPYGTVGRLPWQRWQGEVGAPFGASEDQDLLSISKQIKTFTERVEEGTALNEARQRVAAADVIVFLGFAFHRQNLELLDAGTEMCAGRVFGTVRGISSDDLEVVKGQISRLLRKGITEYVLSVATSSSIPASATFTPSSAARLHLADVTCSRLFQNYWRSLSQLPSATARPERRAARARSGALIEKAGKAGA